MENVIITTKGSNGGLKVLAFIVGVLSLVLGIIFVKANPNVIDKIGRGADVGDWIAFLAPFVFIIIGILLFVAAPLTIGASYLDVYSDRICGKGIEGKGLSTQMKPVAFSFRNDQISSVTISGATIFINTLAGQYRVMSNSQKAQEVFEYFSRLKQS